MARRKFTCPSTVQTVCQLSPAVILPYQFISLVQQALLLATLFTITVARRHVIPLLLQSVPRGPCRVTQPVNLRASPWPAIHPGRRDFSTHSLRILESRTGKEV